MVRVGTMSVSDYYGETADKISDEMFSNIRNIIQTLYDHDVLYIDITGYNFIENDNKLWIIDFGHATYNYPRKMDEFVEKFLEGHNGWNPEFLWNRFDTLYICIFYMKLMTAVVHYPTIV